MTICAYCGARVMQADRKCACCGSTVFTVTEEAKANGSGASGGGMAQAAQAQAWQAPPEYRTEPNVVYQTIHHNIYVEREISRRNRWIALLLCGVFGLLGVHRFYAGKNATGVLYLLTGGLFGVGAFVDFLSILFGSFRDADGLKLSS